MKQFAFYLFISLTYPFVGEAAKSYVGKFSLIHPEAILTKSDYDILLPTDFEWNGEVRPFGKSFSSYTYWQCVPSEDVRVTCRDFGFDEISKDHFGEAEIEFFREGELHGFGQRRAFEITWCRETVSKWKQMLKSSRHVCVAGMPIGQPMERNGVKVFDWIYDRMRTKSDCHEYFVNGCRR